MTAPTEKEWHVVTVGVEPHVRVFVAKNHPGQLEFWAEIQRLDSVDESRFMRTRAGVIVDALNEKADREAK